MKLKIGMRIPPRIGAEGMEQTAVWAAAAGLDVLDVPYVNPEVISVCERAGIGIGSVDAVQMGALLSRDDGRREAAAEAVREQMTEMAALGAKVMFMCLVPEDHTVPRSESFAIWKDTFPAIVSHAEQQGVYIAIEGWPGPAPYYPTIGCTPEMWRKMFEAIPSKHFGLNYDPSHLVRLGIDYIRALHEFGERVNHCHGKDTELLPDEQYECGVLPATFGARYGFSEGSWRYTIPGHGAVEWSKVAVRLDRLGYQGAISIELEDHRYWGSLEKEREGIVKAAAHLSAYFK
ncbi:sugar phosphate isomerase/epimerase family protein [Paenibacillus sp. GCM10023248]|uniref:sugar phosphate isomerase/epimerase family protein n=1 Tax=Bacillales TaxID=1385 RepID=UPI0023792575|nr:MULTISPECIES: sugar phosphate isomerase/epimerase [Bacillales]MDD9268170.1 sugar phosphate isomerase/epimerase [Paenibacillus sp. MAHUQ-63]MDR6879849.1 sugar phosphate isomerase/epimerase [Bacillus sp. 3255]